MRIYKPLPNLTKDEVERDMRDLVYFLDMHHRYIRNVLVHSATEKISQAVMNYGGISILAIALFGYVGGAYFGMGPYPFIIVCLINMLIITAVPAFITWRDLSYYSRKEIVFSLDVIFREQYWKDYADYTKQAYDVLEKYPYLKKAKVIEDIIFHQKQRFQRGASRELVEFLTNYVWKCERRLEVREFDISKMRRG